MNLTNLLCNTLYNKPVKFVYHFKYIGSSVSSTGSDVNIRWEKVCTIIDGLSIIWKFNLSDRIKQEFFQVVAVSVLLYHLDTSEALGEKLDGETTQLCYV